MASTTSRRLNQNCNIDRTVSGYFTSNDDCVMHSDRYFFKTISILKLQTFHLQNYYTVHTL